MREDQTFKLPEPGTIYDLPQCELNYVYVTRQVLPKLKKENEESPEDIFDIIEHGPFVITGFIHMNEEIQCIYNVSNIIKIHDNSVKFARTSRKTVFIKLRNVYLYKIEQLSNNSLIIWVIGQRALYAIRNVSDEYKETFNIVMDKANLYLCLKSIRKNETKECIFTFSEYLEQISYVYSEKILKIKNKLVKYSKFLFFMMLDDISLNWPVSLFFKGLKELCNDSFEAAKLNKKKVEILRNEAINTLKLNDSFINDDIINNGNALNDSFGLQNNFFNIDFSLTKSQNRILTYPFPRANAEGRKLYNNLEKALMHIPFKPEDLDIETAAIFLGDDLDSVDSMREKIKCHAEGLIDFIKISKKWEKSILFKQLIDISKGVDVYLRETDSMFLNKNFKKIYDIKNKINPSVTPIKNISKKRNVSQLANDSSTELNDDIDFKTNLLSKKEFLYKITDQLISEIIDSQKYSKKYNLKIFIDNITENFKISYEDVLKFILENIEHFVNLTIQKHTEIYKDLENMLIFKSNFSKESKFKSCVDDESKISSKYDLSETNILNSIEDLSFKNKKRINKEKYVKSDVYEFQTYNKNKTLNLDTICKSSDIELNSQEFNSMSINIKKTAECLKKAISHGSYKLLSNTNSIVNKQNKLTLNSLRNSTTFLENKEYACNNSLKQNIMNDSLYDINLKYESSFENIMNKLNCKMTPENLRTLVDKSVKKNTTLVNSEKSDNKNDYFDTKIKTNLQLSEQDDPVINGDLSFNKFTKTLLESSLIKPGRGKPMLQIIPFPPTQPAQNSKLWFCPLKNCNYFSETFVSNRIYKTIIEHLKYHRNILSSKDKCEDSENHKQKNETVRSFVDKLETIASLWNLQSNEIQL
ncbi:hypothetical protein PORY_000555 [Pneumocystis oryctolagi]|uniref:Uncharacterized protein n=1 Tax=Pneumocystis oryctolagi TaxID=42067 RepID=A0ACB7CHV2_9ASCO|nr:hypothetical protein PORY_000555 [Pneumocystis oryctolagi]